ncbi:hypothetical protein IJM16_00585 [Candidatus Saccharibacteria bacterium]|nr:hypothetical protein [Candidatus Saccharibacteria bacterium]
MGAKLKLSGRTAPEQIKKGLKEGQNEVWWILLGSGFLAKALLHYASSVIKMQAFLLRSEACSREPLVLAQ